ncbi:MAG: hypothetical protein V1694_01540 [Candidatus Eisenbacteria bacterium]
MNFVQEQMMQSEGNYDRLKRLLRDKEFREMAKRLMKIDPAGDGVGVTPEHIRYQALA